MLHFQMTNTIKYIYRIYVLLALYYIGGTAQFTSPKGTVVCDSLSKELRTNHPRHYTSAHSLMTDWHELMQIYKEAE